MRIDSLPYAWPYDGVIRPDNTCFLVIDMQVDFCGEGGYVDQMGYDLSLTQAPIEPIKRVMAACRAYGYPVIHTREGHRPNLADLPANKKWRSEQIGAGIGSMGPKGRVLTRGEPGWELIRELAPLEGETIIDKPGKGCFSSTDLDLVLRNRGISRIVLAGITTDVCVHTTMREANDLGFECLLLTDCTAATDPANHLAAIEMVKKQGGVFGAVAPSSMFLAAITPPVVQFLAGEPGAVGHPNQAVVAAAKPYPYRFTPSKCALVMADFSRDFMEVNGFAGMQSNDVELLRACLPAAKALLDTCRSAGMAVVYVLEAHKPDLSDVPLSKYTRMPPNSRIGDVSGLGRALIQGEPGSEVVPELAPQEGELCLFKPGKGSFGGTDLDAYLHDKGVTSLIFAGVTTDGCVQTSIREANDKGYECLLVTDATESFVPEFKASVLDMLVSLSGFVGWTASSAEVAAALAPA